MTKKEMTRKEELNGMMLEGYLGYANVYLRGDGGKHTDFLFKMTGENIANVIGKYELLADKIVMTDFCDRLICESIFGGFLMSCPDQKLCQEIVRHLAPIQMGDNEPKEIVVATREEMEAVWAEEEAMVMEAEIRML